jgi:hypothetical protein
MSGGSVGLKFAGFVTLCELSVKRCELPSP